MQQKVSRDVLADAKKRLEHRPKRKRIGLQIRVYVYLDQLEKVVKASVVNDTTVSHIIRDIIDEVLR